MYIVECSVHQILNNYIQETVVSAETGKPPNLPMTGWEGMLGAQHTDQLQQCAILAQAQ